MKSNLKMFTYSKLKNLKENNFLIVNREYQRSGVWTTKQKQLLIDSLLRNYQLPLIYLHHKSQEIDDMKQERYEIIDGQQRIDAITEFMNNQFKLLNPKKNQNIFPKFIQKEETTWSEKYFESLSEIEKEKFIKQSNGIVVIETDNDNEIRDLFIRLQGGLPLNAQEKRDAWPGNFRNLVLQIAGKKETEFIGHDFIVNYIQNSARDRGNLRKIAAQLIMTFFEYKYNNGNFLSLKSTSVDSYYHRHIDMDLESEEVKYFIKKLDLLYSKFRNYKGRSLKVYEAIDLLLFVEDLTSYSLNGNDILLTAFEEFREELAFARKQKAGDFYEYVINASTSSDEPESIRKRHHFFAEQMLVRLKPSKLDDLRNFSENDKIILYYKYGKSCAKCMESLSWADMEIHHLIPFSKGGKTIIENGVPVHQSCHPKSEKEVTEFEESMRKLKESGIDISKLLSSKKHREEDEFKKKFSVSDYKNVNNIEELMGLEIKNWKELCLHFKIDAGKSSARWKFEIWRKVNRPDWANAL